MAKQRIRAALTLVLILCVGVGCAARSQEPLVQRTGSEPLTAKQAYPIAKARAQAWQANAYLAEVIIVIPNSEFEGGPRKIDYVFIADHAMGPIQWWDTAFITVDAYHGGIIAFKDYNGATTPQGKLGRFDIESAVLDSSDALRMAESLGGKAYREKYPNAQVRIIGTHGLVAPGEIFWDVGYFRPPDVRYDELGFGIEARTGEVRGDAYVPPSLPSK